MEYQDSFCALCGLPWFAETKPDTQRPAAEASHDEGNMDDVLDDFFSPLNITEEEISWLGDFRGIVFNDKPNVQKYDSSINLYQCAPGLSLDRCFLTSHPDEVDIVRVPFGKFDCLNSDLGLGRERLVSLETTVRI